MYQRSMEEMQDIVRSQNAHLDEMRNRIAALEAEKAELLDALEIAMSRGYPADSVKECAFCHGDFNSHPYKEHHKDCEWAKAETTLRKFGGL